VTVHAASLAQLAVMDFEDGDWALAQTRTKDARDAVLHAEVGGSPMLLVVECMTAVVLAKQGRVDEAIMQGRRAMRAMAVMSNLPSWSTVQSHYLLGRMYLLLDDTEAARRALSGAQKHLAESGDASALHERLDGAWRQVEKTPLAWGSGPNTLTTAELRVLQYLPTHLSFEQIGNRLFVSRNTIKTQAIAAYRKLGVTSRAEAVERAQGLGLVSAS
jgi:LuxR family maltose regulon positive regulatory protein